MRRREFIKLISGTVVAWPLAARAQRQPMPVLGYLDPTSPGEFAEPRRAFLQGLKEAGYVEDKNVAISYRFAENQIASSVVLSLEEGDATTRFHFAHRKYGGLAAAARRTTAD